MHARASRVPTADSIIVDKELRQQAAEPEKAMLARIARFNGVGLSKSVEK